jgi:O-antigen ligase
VSGLATQPVSRAPAAAGGRAAAAGVSAGAAVLAAAVPLVFLHISFQPSLSARLGGSDVEATLADVAVLAVVLAALLGLVREGAAPLRSGWPLWAAIAALLAWIGISTVWPALAYDDYAFADNVVTTLKFSEYALLAPAVVVLVRGAADLRLVLGALAAWGGLAAGVGTAQFFGADVFDPWRAGYRQPSFLGHHYLASLALVGLGAGVVWLLLGERWRGFRLHGVLGAAGGALGLVLSGAVAGLVGLAAGALLASALCVVRFRPSAVRLAAVAALVAVVGAGVVALRGGDLASFARFLGADSRVEQRGIESYSHRTVLAYIGLRIWLDHPVVGIGWQESEGERGYGPYLDDARRRFPEVFPEAFPGPEREWGVQNGYVQALADLGAIGLALFLAVPLAGIGLGARALFRRGPVAAGTGALALVLVVGLMGLWSAHGLIAGVPLDAATWLALGLAATALARAGTLDG